MECRFSVMDTMELVERLTSSNPSRVPELLREAVEQREAITPALLAILERDAKRLNELNENTGYAGHIYAIFLLAQFREPRAYPLIVEFFSAPDEDYEVIFGDMLTEDLPQILASVYDGNDAPLRALIENTSAYEFSRAAGLQALLHLVAMGLKTREEVLDYIAELLTVRLEKEQGSYVYGDVIYAAALLQPAPCMDAIRAAFASGYVDESVISLSFVEKRLALDFAETWRHFRPPYFAPVADVPDMFAQWEAEQMEAERKHRERSRGYEFVRTDNGERYAAEASGTVVRAQEKVGPNDSCPCGSQRKFKKCCGKLA